MFSLPGRLVAEPLSSLQRVSVALGFALALMGLICSAFAGVWFIGDFIEAAVNSPNLGAESQVADFNDFHYLATFMAQHHFRSGVLLLLAAVACIIQGALLIAREGRANAVFLVGAAALALEVGLLIPQFSWLVFCAFLLTAAGLYLGTEWQSIARTAVDDDEDTAFANFSPVDDGLDDEGQATLDADQLVTEAAKQVPANAADPILRREPVLPDVSGDSSPPDQDVTPPTDAAEQEMPPLATKPRVWNVFDWVVVGLILLFVFVIILVLIAR